MGTPARYYSSTAVRTTLAASVSSTDTEIIVASSTNFPSQYPFTLILEKDSANEEITIVTGVVGTALVVTRGFDGTSARAHSVGTSVEHGVSAKDFTDQRAHEAASNNVHDIGAGAAVVGTTTTQTLTNKTLGGNLAAGGFKVTGLGDPSSAQDAATKNWAETGMTSQLALATTQATNAGTSASASATSATASATSATASQASRVASESARDSALTSQTAATASQSAAATSATNSATSASTSTTQAASATSSASSASTSAAAASASQSAAATSATNASSSAVSASNSAAAAATSLDSFDDRYLGAKTSAPTLDNDGNALLQGALYYLSTGSDSVKGMYVYDGASWIKATSSSVATIATFEYTATASQTVFTGADDNSLSMSFVAGLVQVFLNGVLLNPGNDYTTSTNTVTLPSGSVVGDALTVVAFSSFTVADVYTIAQVDAAIASVDALPSQSGNSGKYLTTDGTDSSWATVAGGSSEQTFTNNFMMMGA